MMFKDNRFFAALRFLTILPVPGKIGASEKALQGAVIFFPVVGALLGLAAYSFAMLAWQILPPLLAAVSTVIVMLLFSGGFHMDGLADTADGFFSSRPRERVLEIMRDSRIGVMGVVWVVAVMLVKTASLYGLDSNDLGAAIFLMPLAGRCLMVVNMVLLTYVRKSKGLASLFYQQVGGGSAFFALVFLLVSGWLAAGLRGLFCGLATVCFLAIYAWYCKVKIGGATGDTLGGGCELVEMWMALCFAVNFV